jgi:hypothetical protein
MGRTLLNYPNTDTSDPSNYPDGRIKDDPSGIDGTPIAEVTWGDQSMFFDKLMRFAGINPNNLPDNETNGYQFMQAMNKLYSNADNGLAEAFGASGFVPVRMSGIVITPGVSPTLNVSAGYFYYNNKLYRFAAGSYNGGISPSVAKPCLLLSTTDGLPTATIGMVNVPITPDANKVPLENLVEWAAGVGITALQNQVALGAWVTPSAFGSGWAAGITPAPRYRKDGMGRVYMQGIYRTTGASPSTDITVLPAGYRPAVDTLFPVIGYNGSNFIAGQYLRILADGTVQLLTAGSVTGAGWYFDTGCISFLNS